jgi:hypothetical protein
VTGSLSGLPFGLVGTSWVGTKGMMQKSHFNLLIWMKFTKSKHFTLLNMYMYTIYSNHVWLHAQKLTLCNGYSNISTTSSSLYSATRKNNQSGTRLVVRIEKVKKTIHEKVNSTGKFLHQIISQDFKKQRNQHVNHTMAMSLQWLVVVEAQRVG